jgi:hypothetical protein
MNDKDSKLEIGYVPYSENLEHPADRRRLAAWAKARDFTLNLVDPLQSDVLVLSNAANFAKWIGKYKGKVVLDLVDGYWGENPSFLKDFARNCLRSYRGTSSLHWVRYTRHLQYAIEHADSIVVASNEQLQSIRQFNKNISVIPDIHLELESEPGENHNTSDKIGHEFLEDFSIMWEGFGYTLKHLEIISDELDEFLCSTGANLYLVTNEVFPRWGGFLGRIHTQNLVNSWFKKSYKQVQIIPWTIENLVKISKRVRVAVIPIDTTDKFASLKSENKLLSMWRLGLICFFSPIPSYSRVAINAGVTELSVRDEDWSKVFHSISNSEFDFEVMRLRTSEFLKFEYSHADLHARWDQVLSEVINHG